MKLQPCYCVIKNYVYYLHNTIIESMFFGQVILQVAGGMKQ